MKPTSKRSRFVWLLPAIIAGGTGAYWLGRGAISGDKQTTEMVEQGVTLTTIERGGVQPLRMFVVRTDFARGWRLRVVASDGSVTGQYFSSGSGLKRTTVSHMLTTHNRIYKESPAPVAVNGGFFAYEGAAVGAVKLSNQWIRPPWKNRTAIGFSKDGKAKIDNLRGTTRLVFGNGSSVSIAGLNSHPIKNAVTVLTPHFAGGYKLKPDEIALFVDKGEIHRLKNNGTVSISPEGFLIVANGSARASIEEIPLSPTKRIAGEDIVTATSARLEVVTTPSDWQNYPTILGAGPRLVRNGQVHTTEVDEEFRPDVTRRGPRTAIGIDKAGNYFLVVVKGGLEYSTGLTLPELGQEMKALGAVDAINLDGGASVALVVKDNLITPKVPEVPVANAVLVVREKPTP